MLTVDDIVAKLPGARKSGRGYSAKCPAHEDKNASLSVWQDEHGNTGLHCFAGCHRRDICAALGIKEEMLYADYDERRQKKPASKVMARYDYIDTTGAPIVRVERLEGKRFRRLSPDGNGGWKFGGTDNAVALYHWPELASAVRAGKTVFLVEGEKDVDNMCRAGAVATTFLGGASNWTRIKDKPEFFKEFVGAAQVYIISDRDTAANKYKGQHFALDEKEALAALGVPVRAVCLPATIGLKKVKDASDALDAGWDLAKIEEWCQNCDEVTLPQDLPNLESSLGAGGAKRKPEEAATLKEAIGIAIENAAWYDDMGHMHPPRAEEKRAAVKTAGVEWMLAHGGFYRDTESSGSASLYFYESATRRLYSMEKGSEAFEFWLGWASGLDAVTNEFRTLLQACREAAMYDSRSIEVAPSLFWESRDGALYVSNGDGEMARITEGGVEIVENGTDGVLFRMGRTCAPWNLLDESEGVPLYAMRLVGGISTPDNPLAPLLLLLWILALPRNLKNKPPLSLCGDVGSGKTRSARGIYEILGLTERVSTADKTDKGEEQFWVSVGYGGVSTIDNVDSKCHWLADAISGASTGGQKEKRTLYTDSDLTFLRSRSAVVLTSANPYYAADAGLADRLINIVFERQEGRATSDGELSEEISQARDGLMTWLCWTLSRALRVKDTPPKGLNRRHPDWADWCWRCGVALGFREEAEKALNRAEADKPLISVMSDRFLGAVLVRVMTELGQPWEGTANELRNLLVKGGGDDCGHDPATRIVFPAGSVTPEEYDERAKQTLTAHYIGIYFKNTKVALSELLGLSSRISAGHTLWRLSPPGDRSSLGGGGGVEMPFQTFIKKKFFNEKVKNGGSTPPTPPLDESSIQPDEGGETTAEAPVGTFTDAVTGETVEDGPYNP